MLIPIPARLNPIINHSIIEKPRDGVKYNNATKGKMYPLNNTMVLVTIVALACLLIPLLLK
jgi:hypothetical protein